MIIKKRGFVRKDRVFEIRDKIDRQLGIGEEYWAESGMFEVVETDKDVSFIVIDKIPIFFGRSGEFFPTLKAVLSSKIVRKVVVVDKGAVRFVVNGADIMKPGIVEFDDTISKGEVITVVEENHRKPLAIGVSLLDADDIEREDKGKIIKNVHFIGDKIWVALEKI